MWKKISLFQSQNVCQTLSFHLLGYMSQMGWHWDVWSLWFYSNIWCRALVKLGPCIIYRQYCIIYGQYLWWTALTKQPPIHEITFRKRFSNFQNSQHFRIGSRCSFLTIRNFFEFSFSSLSWVFPGTEPHRKVRNTTPTNLMMWPFPVKRLSRGPFQMSFVRFGKDTTAVIALLPKTSA